MPNLGPSRRWRPTLSSDDTGIEELPVRDIGVDLYLFSAMQYLRRRPFIIDPNYTTDENGPSAAASDVVSVPLNASLDTIWYD